MLSTKSKKYILIGLVFHLIAIVFSIGFYTHDEQREVLQIVGFKLGMYDSSYLSFQFQSMLRSWLHPLIYILPSKLYLLFFELNPFNLAFIYRLISSLLGIVSLWLMYTSFSKRFQDTFQRFQDTFFFFAGLLWFLPFLHARTANENLCTSFFIFGLYYLMKEVTFKNAILAGALFSLSFILRVQLAFMIAPTVLWFLLFDRYPIKKYLVLTLSFFVVLAFNTMIDSYYYGRFSFTPYNYFYINIVQKYAAQFGVTPWYDYFLQALKDGGPPLSLLFIIVYLTLWIRFPKSLLTWISLPFFIVHSLVGHKELRFIFPMIFFLPAILAYLICELKIELKRKWIIFFLVFNIPPLLYASFVPASNLMKYYKYLYNKPAVVSKVYVTSPHEDFTKFYLKNDVKYELYKTEEMNSLVASDKKVYFFAMNLKERNLLLEHSQCQIDFSLFPVWMYELEFIKKRRTFKSWTLVECSN